jgi:hypothetical protein
MEEIVLNEKEIHIFPCFPRKRYSKKTKTFSLGL